MRITECEKSCSHACSRADATLSETQVRFVLSGGAASLYAFWLTDSAQGASDGLLGGGKFGVRGVVDQ